MPKTKEVEKPVVDEVKSYDEKVSDYEKHFDDIGMHDPSTEAAILQMKTAPVRWEESDAERAPDLIERDRVRDEKRSNDVANPGDVVIGDQGKTRKEANEALSEVVTDRKEHDEEEQRETELGLKANIDRGGSEEAETGLQGKQAKVAVNEAKAKAASKSSKKK